MKLSVLPQVYLLAPKQVGSRTSTVPSHKRILNNLSPLPKNQHETSRKQNLDYNNPDQMYNCRSSANLMVFIFTTN